MSDGHRLWCDCDDYRRHLLPVKEVCLGSQLVQITSIAPEDATPQNTGTEGPTPEEDIIIEEEETGDDTMLDALIQATEEMLRY